VNDYAERSRSIALGQTQDYNNKCQFKYWNLKSSP